MLKVKKQKSFFLFCLMSVTLNGNSANKQETNENLLLGEALRHDTSAPLIELLDHYEELKVSGQLKSPIPDYVVPNILKIEASPAEVEFLKNQKNQKSSTRGVIGTNGLESPPVNISVDGYTAGDNVALFGGSALPPDTNGDVGINFYIQYVNTGWLILNKNDGSRAAGPFAGNVFWAGFGGPCQTNNSGDPIVLYDKQADRWVFSQFTSPSNTDGRQCFAISTTNDPLGPYHRYEFLFPGEFNDYPHIGIWDDESGTRSGYYLVTHDFFDVGGPNQSFRQASFAVVERTKMLAGDEAQFVRFTDTVFNQASSFGALPAHLESKKLAPTGMCNPFIFGRPDLNGYQIVDLCVNWNNTATSFLTDPLIVDAGENWNPGPGGVSQPGTDQQLGTLASFGRIMYRASFRAYPDEIGLKDTMVISLPVDIGGGQAAVRWAQLEFPDTPRFGDFIFQNGFEDNVTPADPISVANQGEYAPDNTDRWMSGISIDKAGNIGLAYTATNSDENIFPGVRFTTRAHGDEINTLRQEQVCVDGSGIQTSGSGRWGDYSSLSVDPVDECTFWASIEYPLSTASGNWSNRVCSFKMLECGGPTFNLTSDDTTIEVCTAPGSETINATVNVDSILNFTNDVNLAFNPSLPNGFSGSLTPNLVTPEGSSDLELVITDQAQGQYSIAVEGTALDSENRTINFDVKVANSFPELTSLNSPMNNATGINVSSIDFSWNAVNNVDSYLIEISTDPGFNSIVDSANIMTNSYQSTVGFNTNTTFYWRVSSFNLCGQSSNSTTSQFTTGSFVTGTSAECAIDKSTNIVFFDNIEGDISDWSLPNAPIGTNTWTQSNARSYSGNSWFAVDSNVSSDQYLVSPEIVLPAIQESPISLSYWNFQEFEANTGVNNTACWDGGLLEISLDGGNSFTQISNSELLGDPYNGSITNQGASPISGLDAWCASSLLPVTGEQTDVSVINLDAYAGQTVQFRFRVGTDGNTGAEGWYIDDVTVQSCLPD